MKDEVKQELIIILEKENQILREQINQLLEKEERLRQRLADLQSAAAFGRRGLPWR